LEVGDAICKKFIDLTNYDFDDELTFDKIISAVDYTIHSGNNYSDKTMLMDVYDEFTLLPPDAPRNLSVDQLERNLQLSCDTIHKAASLFKTYAENDSYELYSYSKNGDDKVSKVEITLCT
jgi:hypothetical protein